MCGVRAEGGSELLRDILRRELEVAYLYGRSYLLADLDEESDRFHRMAVDNLYHARRIQAMMAERGAEPGQDIEMLWERVKKCFR